DAAQIFNYNISDYSTETGKVDYVWGSQTPIQPSGMYNTAYLPFNRDDNASYGRGGHDLAWWQANHPDWVEFKCNASTVSEATAFASPGTYVAYIDTDPNVPLDFTNSAEQAYIESTFIAPWIQAGYQGMAFDNVEFDNAGSWTGARCGHYDLSG